VLQKKLYYGALFISTVYVLFPSVDCVVWTFSSSSCFCSLHSVLTCKQYAFQYNSENPRTGDTGASFDGETQRRVNDGATLTSADSSCNFLDKNRDKPSYSRENRRDFDTGEFMVVENVFSVGCGGWKVGDTTSEPSNEILHPIIKSSHKSSGDGDVRLCAQRYRRSLARPPGSCLPCGRAGTSSLSGHQRLCDCRHRICQPAFAACS